MTDTSIDTSLEFTLEKMVEDGSFSKRDKTSLLANRDYFEENQDRIKREFRNLWVAILDHIIYSAPTLRNLTSELKKIDHSHSAYIVKII